MHGKIFYIQELIFIRVHSYTNFFGVQGGKCLDKVDFSLVVGKNTCTDIQLPLTNFYLVLINQICVLEKTSHKHYLEKKKLSKRIQLQVFILSIKTVLRYCSFFSQTACTCTYNSNESLKDEFSHSQTI